MLRLQLLTPDQPQQPECVEVPQAMTGVQLRALVAEVAGVPSSALTLLVRNTFGDQPLLRVADEEGLLAQGICTDAFVSCMVDDLPAQALPAKPDHATFAFKPLTRKPTAAHKMEAERGYGDEVNDGPSFIEDFEGEDEDGGFYNVEHDEDEDDVLERSQLLLPHAADDGPSRGVSRTAIEACARRSAADLVQGALELAASSAAELKGGVLRDSASSLEPLSLSCPAGPTRPIRTYAWTDKRSCVKIYVNSDSEADAVAAAESGALEHMNVSCTPSSFLLWVRGKTALHVLKLEGLWGPIIPGESQVSVAPGKRIVLELRKQPPLEPWDSLLSGYPQGYPSDEDAS